MSATTRILPTRPPSPALGHWPSLVSHSVHAWEKDRPPGRSVLKQFQSSAPTARARRERPCDGCRRRKSKCVIQDSGRCVLCDFHQNECTFVEDAQPRKRKTLDAAASKTGSPIKKATLIPATAPRPPPPPPNAGTPPIRNQGPRRAFVAGAPAMRESATVDESLGLQRHRHCKYLGQTTPLDASLIARRSFDHKNETESQWGTLRQVTANEYFTTGADDDGQVPYEEARAVAEIEQIVGPQGPALMDVYFRNVHPSYPIMQRQAFMDRYRKGDRQFNPPLLAAMYLLATGWWDRDPALSSHPKPDLARLESIAMSSLAGAMHRPKISAVQAGLLLLQRAKSSTWALAVQVVALGQEIGLHLDCSGWSIPRWEQLLRKRLAWALYVHDKWSALVYGRPSHIHEADWNVPPPTAEDFDETMGPPLPTPADDAEGAAQKVTERMVFMQMVALTGIMAEVCDTFYSEAAKGEFARAGRYTPQLVLNRAKPVQIKLKDWFARLPAGCKMECFTPGQRSPQGYLHLAYFATEISIHRRIVQSLDPPTVAPYMLYICRSAAKTRLISALDFVNRLRPEHLHAFWFFASAANFALVGTFGALLMTTSPGHEEAHFYACRLHEYQWSLTVSSKEAAWMQGALETLAATGKLLRGLSAKPAVTSPPMEGRCVPVSTHHHHHHHGEREDGTDDDDDARSEQTHTTSSS